MSGGEYQVPPKTHHWLLHNHLILRGHLPYIGTKAHPGRSTEPSPESCSSPTLLGVTQAGLPGLQPTSSSSQVGEEASLNSLLKMSLTNSTSCPLPAGARALGPVVPGALLPYKRGNYQSKHKLPGSHSAQGVDWGAPDVSVPSHTGP